MTEHRASCQCGAVQAVADAPPKMVAACNCDACRKKTGSAFGAGVFFDASNVLVSGDTWKWDRMSEAGNQLTQHFCPGCGTTVFWFNSGRPGIIALSYGCFSTDVPAPDKVVWGCNQSDWVSFADGIPVLDKA